jgi:hypothetical protein
MYCDIPVDQFFITYRSGAAPRPLCATHGCLATTTNTDRNDKTMFVSSKICLHLSSSISKLKKSDGFD